MAATGPLTDWLPLIRPQVPLALDPVLTRGVLWAVKRFLTHTATYVEDLTPLTLTLNSSGPYTPTLPQDADLVAYQSVTQNGLGLNIARRQDMNHIGPQWQTQTGGQIRAVYTEGDNALYVWPSPTDVTYPLDIRAVMTLLDSATTYPSFLFSSWQDAIVRGALAYTKTQMDQPWTDLEGGELAGKLFQDELEEAGIRQALGYATQARYARVPFFGA